MAVAAALGGASPNFNELYNEVNRLARKLSEPSPREINDPGQTLKLVRKGSPGVPPKEYDTYIRTYIDKEKGVARYKLYFKDDLNQEQLISDGNHLSNTLFGAALPAQFSINGQDILNGQTLKIDKSNGRIIYNPAADPTLNVDTPGEDTLFDTTLRNNVNNVTLGVLKLNAVNGLDVGLVNERVSQVNLVIEALNKVLIVAGDNAQKAVDLRL